MTRARATLLAGCAATIAFALAFTYPAYGEVRVFWYYPLEHRWAFELEPRGLAMDWYGRVALGGLASLIVLAVGYPLLRRVERAVSDRLIGLATAWALSATLAAMAFYGWELARRKPVPEPIPAGYQRR